MTANAVVTYQDKRAGGHDTCPNFSFPNFLI